MWYYPNFTPSMTDMKKRILLFSFIMFFAALCTGLFADQGKTQSYADASSKAHILKQSDNQTQADIYDLSDDQDTQDSEDPEKVKFDYSIITQQWLNFFFNGYTYNTKVAAVQNRVYITAPRYILYQSLQIAGC